MYAEFNFIQVSARFKKKKLLTWPSAVNSQLFNQTFNGQQLHLVGNTKRRLRRLRSLYSQKKPKQLV
jgi:hypothetical protein